MTTRTVVTRTRRTSRQEDKKFAFTRQMIPALSGDWDAPTFLKEYRSQAWEAYDGTSMPTPREEPWRRTDLRSLPAASFRLAAEGESKDLETPPAELLQPLAGEDHGGQIVISPQGVKVHLAPELSEQGVIFTDLRTAERQHPAVMERILGRVVRPDEGKFAALAGALARDGVLLYVPRGVHVEQPLHSILWGPGADLAYISHLLVLVDEGASVTYVHEAASHTEPQGATMHTGLVEIQVEAGANLRFVELQSWGENVWNFSHERAHVERDANLDWNSLDLTKSCIIIEIGFPRKRDLLNCVSMLKTKKVLLWAQKIVFLPLMLSGNN